MTALLLIALSVGILFFLVKSRRNYMALPELPLVAGDAAEHAALSLSIVIPARNESHQIERAIRGFRHVPVIVVDDASTDNTAGVAASAGAQVIAAPPLPSGAKGKPNACLEGARHATTKWICFVDADTWFEPPFAASLVAYAEREQLDMVSCFLDSRTQTCAEKLLLPYAFALYFAGVSARRVNDPRSSQALANGQCMLFRRAAYERIGGHGAVLNSVIEDVALAAVAKKAGLNTGVLRAESLGCVRMYDGFASLWRGFQKNSFRFLLVNPSTGAQVMVASILLTSWLPALVYAAVSGIHGSLLLGAAILLAVPSVGMWPWYRGSFVWSALTPAAIYGFQLIALDGVFSTITPKKAVWKGRRV